MVSATHSGVRVAASTERVSLAHCLGRAPASDRRRCDDLSLDTVESAWPTWPRARSGRGPGAALEAAVGTRSCAGRSCRVRLVGVVSVG